MYIGHTDNGITMVRFVIQYVADDWLFIEQFVIKADDQTFTIDKGHFDVSRDNSAGEIWEWIDESAGDREISIARAIAESDRAVIRHRGDQYHYDRVITNNEKQAIRQTLEAADALVRRENLK